MRWGFVRREGEYTFGSVEGSVGMCCDGEQ